MTGTPAIYLSAKWYAAVAGHAKTRGLTIRDVAGRAFGGYFADVAAREAFYGAGGNLLTPEYCRAKALEADSQANDLDLMAERFSKAISDAFRAQATTLRRVSQGWTWMADKVTS